MGKTQLKKKAAGAISIKPIDLKTQRLKMQNEGAVGSFAGFIEF
jgi:hypothetical protein